MSETSGAALLACQRHQREGCPMCLSPIVLGPAFCDVTGNPRPCGCLDCAGPKQAGASSEAGEQRG